VATLIILGDDYMKIEVKSVVCDYGVYQDGKLILVLNDRKNAELVKEILENDLQHKRYKAVLLF
jgi:hypothetical protein